MRTESRIFWSWLVIFMMLDVLDLLTTLYGLQFPGLYETNTASAYLFTFGEIGYMFAMIRVFVIIFVFMHLVKLLFFLYRKMTDSEPPVWLVWSVYSFVAVSFCIGKFDAIVSNVVIILQQLI